MDITYLVSRRCKKLVAREFWRSERLVEEFCAIFLEDDQGDAWKLFLDDEDSTWKLEQVGEVPVAGTVEGNSEFRYPITDLFNQFPIRDEVIQSLFEANLNTYARVQICFSGGQTLTLDYEYATERITANVN